MASYSSSLFLPDQLTSTSLWCAYRRHFSGDESFGDFATTAGAVGLEPCRDEDPTGSLVDDERKMRKGGRTYDEHGDGGSGSSKL